MRSFAGASSVDRVAAGNSAEAGAILRESPEVSPPGTRGLPLLQVLALQQQSSIASIVGKKGIELLTVSTPRLPPRTGPA